MAKKNGNKSRSKNENRKEQKIVSTCQIAKGKATDTKISLPEGQKLKTKRKTYKRKKNIRVRQLMKKKHLAINLLEVPVEAKDEKKTYKRKTNMRSLPINERKSTEKQ